jgi:penicillin amidase
MQTDIVAVPAQRLMALLKPLQSGDARIAQALSLLKGWDGGMGADSAAAALFNVWLMESLRQAVVATLPEPVRAVAATEFSPERLVAWLETPQGGMTAAQRDALLLDSLGRGWDATSRRLGPDAAQWRWGTLHQAVFVHPLSAVVDEPTRARLNVNAGPIPGSPYTPLAASYGADYRLTAGASFRMVLDVGNWDTGRVVNTPGQSGDPASAHYRDLASVWAQGDYFPLLYTRAAVERATTQRLRLEPAR